MIGSLGELFRHEGSGVERAAVVSDVRGGEYFEGLIQVLDELERRRAEAEAALPRGRRGDAARPLQGDAPPPPARAGGPDRRRDPRRARAARAAARARRHGDGHQRPDRRPAAAADRRGDAGRPRGGKLALTLLTFGFKNGPPRDADLTLDVRFLPNPHYVDELRPQTGLDEPVRAYVESGTQAGEFYGRLLPLLEFLVPAYVAEGKSHLTIAVGCTGGRHRSVTVADRIRRALEGREGVVVRVKHRDLESLGLIDCVGFVRAPSSPSAACARATATSRRCAASTSRCERGEVFAFLGPNGAGKTTTVEILEGYRKRSGGEVSVLGEDPERAGRALARADRHRPAELPPRPLPDRARVARPLRRLLRRAAADRGDDRAGRPRRQGRRPRRLALRRPAAPPRRRHGADRRPRAALPRRADDRLRPLGAAPGLGDDRRPARARQDRLPHHPLHGRGAAARRPGDDHRRAARSSPAAPPRTSATARAARRGSPTARAGARSSWRRRRRSRRSTS